eukprot:1145365-Pelagomonas_calceolata.AAC.4
MCINWVDLQKNKGEAFCDLASATANVDLDPVRTSCSCTLMCYSTLESTAHNNAKPLAHWARGHPPLPLAGRHFNTKHVPLQCSACAHSQQWCSTGESFADTLIKFRLKNGAVRDTTSRIGKQRAHLPPLFVNIFDEPNEAVIMQALKKEVHSKQQQLVVTHPDIMFLALGGLISLAKGVVRG